jgi:hypothetical protein
MSSPGKGLTEESLTASAGKWLGTGEIKARALSYNPSSTMSVTCY